MAQRFLLVLLICLSQGIQNATAPPPPNIEVKHRIPTIETLEAIVSDTPILEDVSAPSNETESAETQVNEKNVEEEEEKLEGVQRLRRDPSFNFGIGEPPKREVRAPQMIDFISAGGESWSPATPLKRPSFPERENEFLPFQREFSKRQSVQPMAFPFRFGGLDTSGMPGAFAGSSPFLPQMAQSGHGQPFFFSPQGLNPQIFGFPQFAGQPPQGFATGMYGMMPSQFTASTAFGTMPNHFGTMGSGTVPNQFTGNGFGTGSTFGTGFGTGSNFGTGFGTATNSGTGFGTATSSGTGLGTSSGTGFGTTTNTGTGFGTASNTGTSFGTASNTGATFGTVPNQFGGSVFGMASQQGSTANNQAFGQAGQSGQGFTQQPMNNQIPTFHHSGGQGFAPFSGQTPSFQTPSPTQGTSQTSIPSFLQQQNATSALPSQSKVRHTLPQPTILRRPVFLANQRSRQDVTSNDDKNAADDVTIEVDEEQKS